MAARRARRPLAGARARPSFEVGAAWRRLSDSASAIVQLAVAAVASYSIAHFLYGHETPFLAVTVCLTSLSLARDARPRRVLDTAMGITFGVLLSNLFLLVAGRGLWQLAVVLAVVLALARFVHSSPGFAISAGIQAALVQVIPVAPGAEYTRLLDATTGGAIALLATALVPRNARRLARGDERELLATLARGVDELEGALRAGDQDAAIGALETFRGTDRLLESWSTSLESAWAIASVSPFVRRHREDIDGQRDARRSLDFATRNLRVVARRVSQLLVDGAPRTRLADAFAAIESGLVELAAGIDDPGMHLRARQTFTLEIVRLDPRELAGVELAEATVLMQCRPLLVDLLVATGMSSEEARRALPDDRGAQARPEAHGGARRESERDGDARADGV